MAKAPGKKPRATATSKPSASDVKVEPSPQPLIVDTSSKEWLSYAHKYGAQTAGEYEQYIDDFFCWSTDCLLLDAGIGASDKFGNFGIRSRDVVELLGENGTGKTLTLLHMIKNALRKDPNAIAAILCSEPPPIERMRRMFSVRDMNRIFLIGAYHNPNPEDPKEVQQAFREMLAEECLRNLCNYAKDPKVVIIAIDSVKALVSGMHVFQGGKPALESNKVIDLTKSVPAIRARLMENMFERLLIERPVAVLVMVNHISESIGDERYSKMGAYYRQKTPGGRFKEFMCWVRIEVMSKPLFLKQEHPRIKGYHEQVGLEMQYWIFKNKYANKNGNRKVFVNYLFETDDFDHASMTIDSGLYLSEPRLDGLPFEEIIHVEGTWYTIPGTEITQIPGTGLPIKVQGKAALHALLTANPELRKKLDCKILPRHAEYFSLRGGITKEKDTAKSFLAKLKQSNAVGADRSGDPDSPYFVPQSEEMAQVIHDMNALAITAA